RTTSRKDGLEQGSPAPAAPAWEENFIEPQGGSDRALGTIEEDVEEPVGDIVIAPGPGLLITGREVPDLPRFSDQTANILAGHSRPDPGEIGLVEHLVDLAHGVVGVERDHEGLHGVKALRVFPEFGPVGVFPHGAGRADARCDRQRGIPGGYGGKIRAPGREESESERNGGAMKRCDHGGERYWRFPSLVSTWNRVIFLSTPVGLSNWA